MLLQPKPLGAMVELALERSPLGLAQGLVARRQLIEAREPCPLGKQGGFFCFTDCVLEAREIGRRLLSPA